MRQGEVVETGQAEDIFDRPQHPYTQALMAAALNVEAVESEYVATLVGCERITIKGLMPDSIGVPR